ncbi:hypothetical protein VSX61_21605 [Brenneria populi subsp. brevivirga]|uniref:hypothetical protein n=1 Tax=Brenneria populi TaxID=1505588 RepID=UPI002E199219|nr:hypothetical protein [Brenneria populi subsp. brevivirga]
MKKTTITYDGELMTVSPIKFSLAQQVLSRLPTGESSATFGVDTQAVMPTEFDEFSGALCVCTNNDNAIAFLFLNALFGELFPSGKGGWELTCVGKD